LGTPPPAEENRPGFWKRANPVRWFGSGRDGETNRQATTTTVPKTTTIDTAARPTQLAKASTPPAPRPAPTSFARYDYKRPFPPRPGNRSTAEKFLAAGLKLHRAGNAAGAVTEYSTAVAADPAHFEANYNLGLAAFEAGNYSRSLSAYEQALSIKPTDADARYNFALALDRAGYPVDAANELQTLLSTNDRYVNAHLTLANLYANRLGEPAMARKHYRKVLDLDPKNAESVAIRYWLAANPG
jgi:tetratricopeptide (TPR) repeat protein